jgi:hypothetical protein
MSRCAAGLRFAFLTFAEIASTTAALPVVPQATIVLPESPGNYTVRVYVAVQLDVPAPAYYKLAVPIEVLGAIHYCACLFGLSASHACVIEAATEIDARAYASSCRVHNNVASSAATKRQLPRVLCNKHFERFG